jgi:hypothetical protein
MHVAALAIALVIVLTVGFTVGACWLSRASDT